MGRPGATARATASVRRPLAVLASAGSALSLGVGHMAASSPGSAMAIALVPVLLAVSIVSAGVVGAVAFPAVFLTYRVGPAAVNMSISDLTLLCAIPVAVMTAGTATRPLAGLLRLVATYELVLLAVVSTHPSSLAMIEWAHRLGLMGGGLLVGAAVVRLGARRLALRGLLSVAAIYAGASILFSLRHGLAIAYPLGIHKNAAGGLFAMVIALLATVPVDEVIPARAYRPLYLLYGAGLAATRSRGAMIGLAVVLAILVFTSRNSHRLRVVVALTAIAGLVFVWTSVQDERKADVFKNGSLSVRERQQTQATAAFKAHLLTGAGIRYYDENPSLARDGRPSSTLYEVTAESGVVGAADLLLLVSGVFVIFRRSRGPYAFAAMSVFGVKCVHGLFDNFWVAGPFTLPWLVMGMAALIEYSEVSETGPSTDDSGIRLATASR